MVKVKKIGTKSCGFFRLTKSRFSGLKKIIKKLLAKP